MLTAGILITCAAWTVSALALTVAGMKWGRAADKMTERTGDNQDE